MDLRELGYRRGDPIGFTHTVDLRGLGYTRGNPIGFTHTVDLRGLGYTRGGSNRIYSYCGSKGIRLYKRGIQ